MFQNTRYIAESWLSEAQINMVLLFTLEIELSDRNIGYLRKYVIPYYFVKPSSDTLLCEHKITYNMISCIVLYFSLWSNRQNYVQL